MSEREPSAPLRREQNGGSRPVPDPTVLTIEAIERAIASERERTDGQLAIRDERLAGIDEATKVASRGFTEIPSMIDEKVGHLAERTWDRFESFKAQLETSEAQRIEQKADAKTGLDAALAAQKEGAQEQNRSNTLAIGKSETAMTEAIKKLEDLVGTRLSALSDKIDDTKTRMDRLEAVKQGASERKTEDRAQISTAQAVVGIVLALLVAAGIYFGTGNPEPVVTTPPAVTVTVPNP